ncbi:MAG: arylsulfatase [Planctomycetota bacterium]
MTRLQRRYILWLLALCCWPALAADRPNIILIITDDQGYGDVGAHGNNILKTPNLDALHAESVRLTDYHVDPTCSPTRAALMTGRDSTRTGVWHTINGRSMLAPDEYTLAEFLRDHGYQTAMFGKWHLGDNAPLRPVDQGFDYTVWHLGGGVGQGPDYFDNDYFDDTYIDNGTVKQFEGYCTDVWFEQAMGYMDTAKQGQQPFFIYLSTNAPHGPFIVDEKYSRPYKALGVPGQIANFYGMIENIDENLGRLRAWLKAQGLAENTLLIYTTDNGTARGNFRTNGEVQGFNAGMRAQKGSEYDGGHRVPFFIHWPAKGLDQGRDVDRLMQHIDVLPTLSELLGLPAPDEDKLPRGALDGSSQAVFWLGLKDLPQPEVRFVHSQRTSDPIKWRKSAVMTERWRLVNGKELYDIETDPGQQDDVASDHPDVVAKLTEAYEQWWGSLEPVFDEVVRIDLGGDENPTTLMSHDWLMEGAVFTAWNQSHVRSNALINGPFMVNVARAGRYRITPMRWPEYVDRPSGCIQASIEFSTTGFVGVEAWPVDPERPAGPVVVELPTGPATLTTTLTRADGKTFGAYYVKVELIEE